MSKKNHFDYPTQAGSFAGIFDELFIRNENSLKGIFADDGVFKNLHIDCLLVTQEDVSSLSKLTTYLGGRLSFSGKTMRSLNIINKSKTYTQFSEEQFSRTYFFEQECESSSIFDINHSLYPDVLQEFDMDAHETINEDVRVSEEYLLRHGYEANSIDTLLSRYQQGILIPCSPKVNRYTEKEEFS